MIRITLMDGRQVEVSREEALEILPYRHVFRSSHLKDPVAGIYCHHGKIIPVLGPLPDSAEGKTVDEKPWLLLMNGHAQVVRGLPEFSEAGAIAEATPFMISQDEETSLLSELDDLVKSA
jgi:hypothetical protein